MCIRCAKCQEVIKCKCEEIDILKVDGVIHKKKRECESKMKYYYATVFDHMMGCTCPGITLIKAKSMSDARYKAQWSIEDDQDLSITGVVSIEEVLADCTYTQIV